MGEPNPNLEKFLPALLGIIGRVARVAGASGGGDEEEEKSMDKQQIEKSLLKLMKGGSFYGGTREPKGGVAQGKLPKGDSPWGPEQNKARQEAALERYMDTKFGKEKTVEKGDRDMPIQEHSDIKFRPGPKTHPEHTRIPTPEDPRTYSDVQAPEEESNGFGMGDLEERIANKPRNRPTFPDRAKDNPSRKEREGQYQGSGRPKPEQGATPSFSASLKALNKMLEEGFLSKKADPAMAAQNRSAARQRSAATQERIAGQHAAGAQQVQGPADNTAQQLGSAVADALPWAIRDTQAEMGRGGGQSSSQPREGQPSWAGVDDATSQEDMVSAVTNLQEHVGGTGAASGSGEVNPQPKPDSLGLTTNKPWESANANTAPGTPAAASGTAPSTKPANTGVKTNKPEGLDLTTKAPWKPANSA